MGRRCGQTKPCSSRMPVWQRASRQFFQVRSFMLAKREASAKQQARGLQFPRLAHFAAEQAICFVIADEPLLGGIIAQRTAKPIGDVSQVADRRRALADLGGANTLAAGLDAVDPVLVMIGGVVEPHFVGAERFLDDALRIAFDVAATDFDHAVASLEDAIRSSAVEHDDAAGVDECEAALGIAGRRLDADGAARAGSHGPLCDVEMVRAHVGQTAAGVFAVIAPGREVIVNSLRTEDLVVAAFGRGAEPEVPVGPWRHRLLGQVARDGRVADADVDRLHLANAAVAHALRCLAEHAAVFAALLAAGLENDLRFLDLVHNDAALGDIVRQRLFAVNVLAGAGSVDARDGVPVIGRCDHDGINVLAGQQVAEVIVSLAALVRALAFLSRVAILHVLSGALPPLRDYIADGEHLHVAPAQKPTQMAAAHNPNADEAKRDAFVGFVGAGGTTGQDKWRGNAAGDGTEQLTPGESKAARHWM